jgi:hypothetical protein
MVEVGVWSHSDIPIDAPKWARLFTALGQEFAEQPNRVLGERSPVLFLSVPTGQYAAWFLAAGALGAPPKNQMLTTPGKYRCTTWVENKKQVADADVTVDEIDSGDSLQLRYKVHPDPGPTRRPANDKVQPVATTYVGSKLTLVAHSGNTPEERKGQLNLTNIEKAAIRQAIRPLLEANDQWYLWWTRQCLSPVVIVGTGSEFLMRQRSEILKERPTWMWPTSRTTLALDMKRLCDPSRLLLFPFSIISPMVGARVPWLRSLRPRLVIYTSWTAFAARHGATFAGVPAIVLVNRRVESSLKCAESTAEIRHSNLNSVRSNTLEVRGIDLRLVEYPVMPDDGLIRDLDDDEETPDEF